ncbi:CUN038 similar to AcMNPV ORF22 [Culex nigripalpus nucleopolyhedrovirus]|uniref:CUN038 similar to AcMNPV ORF22 n=1 Tax=Culex nigripalpus nucleopolyhedrovirus (isolate Florida/1997) TaxID=645993 RepID=Q919N1_NPVCO|nr:CUN038 similar to AcMNPV ORF22 [Culex nigripalpus nucleopolyhedrovirus]AAK94116.1 CUN038 similar to AcMNPV ORF22 [Culex nigripalpus nucleopolyhedrovirus]
MQIPPIFPLVVVVLVVLLIVLAIAGPLGEAAVIMRREQLAYANTVSERRELIDDTLSRRKFVPLELLPNIQLNADFGTLDGETLCFQTPILVGTVRQQNFDCSIVCNNVTAQYFFVDKTDRVVVNGDVLSEGGYCTVNSIPQSCARNTSIVLFQLNQWNCIPEDPRMFAGVANMVQVAGRQHAHLIRPDQIDRNVLVDRLLGVPVDITRNIFRQSWDELLEDGTRRFVVQCGALDINNNPMMVNPFNQIECLPNVCTTVRNVHPDVRPNFLTGECECGNENVTRVTHINPNDRSSMCASIVDRFNPTDNSYTFRIDCLSASSPITRATVDKIQHLCPPDVFTSNADAAYSLTLHGVQLPENQQGFNSMTSRQEQEMRERGIQMNHKPDPKLRTFGPNHPNFPR